VRTINGRDRKAWTKDEHAQVEAIKLTEPLLYAGHVGISFDGGRTIYGLTPDIPKGMTPEAALKTLMQDHDAYPGVVGDDTRIFRLAEQMARSKGWATEPISAVELVDKPKKLESLEKVRKMAGLKPGEHGIGYSFPLEQPNEQGSHYRDSNGFCGPAIANCAAFPPMVGVPVPEPSGALKIYMPELQKWVEADAPIDKRAGTSGKDP